MDVHSDETLLCLFISGALLVAGEASVGALVVSGLLPLLLLLLTTVIVLSLTPRRLLGMDGGWET